MGTRTFSAIVAILVAVAAISYWADNRIENSLLVTPVDVVHRHEAPWRRTGGGSRTRLSSEDLMKKNDVSDLMGQLTAGFANIKSATPEDLRKIVRTAEVLIAKTPDAYPAYKGKLLGLLQGELRFGQPVDPNEYERILSQMTQFRHSSRSTMPTSLRSDELEGVDPDLVHIPFLRLAANGDLENLASVAEDYIAVYPKSYIGYFYLAEAHWRGGDEVMAFRTLRQACGSDKDPESLVRALAEKWKRNPLDRLQELRLD